MDSTNTPNTRELVLQFWNLANARDWPEFALLLAPELVYDVPQTRERVVGRAGFVDFYATWPEPWKVEVLQCIAEESKAFTLIQFLSNEPPMTSLTLFESSNGLITKITDFWPAAYEPPPRVSAHVCRY